MFCKYSFPAQGEEKIEFRKTHQQHKNHIFSTAGAIFAITRSTSFPYFSISFSVEFRWSIENFDKIGEKIKKRNINKTFSRVDSPFAVEKRGKFNGSTAKEGRRKKEKNLHLRHTRKCFVLFYHADLPNFTEPLRNFMVTQHFLLLYVHICNLCKN